MNKHLYLCHLLVLSSPMARMFECTLAVPDLVCSHSSFYDFVISTSKINKAKVASMTVS